MEEEQDEESCSATKRNEFEQSLHDFQCRVDVPCNLNKHSILNISFLSKGSSAVIFTGIFGGEKVVIKVSNANIEHDGEIELEHRILERMCHPNIVKIRGAGYSPRKFIILEYLNGGCLYDLLEKGRLKSKSTVFSLFSLSKKPVFLLTLPEVVSIAKQIIQALHYLHENWHPDATIIHRDLKPQNIVITFTGIVKLIDFGLMTCVKKRTQIGEAYQMTGYVGSLRYMAPEVVNHQAYNEKVDIYSFGIILWEMSSGKVFCDGIAKDAYIEKVLNGGWRPDLSGIHFKMARLISSCWDGNACNRPRCEQILARLDEIK